DAVGELSETKRAAVEQQIGESVETLLEIEAIREAAGQLRAALKNEAASPTEPSLMKDLVPRLSQPCATEVSSATRTADTAVAPVSATIAADSSPRRRASGKFAVAASCLALAGVFGSVALIGRR